MTYSNNTYIIQVTNTTYYITVRPCLEALLQETLGHKGHLNENSLIGFRMSVMLAILHTKDLDYKRLVSWH